MLYLYRPGGGWAWAIDLGLGKGYLEPLRTVSDLRRHRRYNS